MINSRLILSTFLLAALTACASHSPNLSESTDTAISNNLDDSSNNPIIEADVPISPPIFENMSTPSFLLYGEESVLPPGRSWNAAGVSMGAVVLHEGVLHMLYYGWDQQGNQPPTEQIGYAVSHDGYEWQHAIDGPVEFSSQPDYLSGNIIVTSLLVESDGTWVMYFFCNATDRSSRWTIGRATATSITGPWTPEDAPVLMPGNPARWDGNGVLTPNVTRTEIGYVMYYAGYEGSSSGFRPHIQIGMATSLDGIAWTKYNDPTTQDFAREDSDPVLATDQAGAWDSAAVIYPQIIHTSEGWQMLYLGQHREERVLFSSIGLATSSDGITWQRNESNPLFNPFEGGLQHNFSALHWLYFQDTHFLYFSAAQRDSDFEEIYLATSE